MNVKRLMKAVGAQGIPWMTLCVAFGVIYIQCCPPVVSFLEFRREAFLSGQLWRLFTWHWVHWGADHLFWDLCAFAVLGALIESRRRRTALGLWLVLSAAVSITVLLIYPGLPSCRGLSGIDSGLFGFLVTLNLATALREGSRGDLVLFSALALAFIAKIAFEGHTGNAVFARGVPFVILPAAHLAGAAAGAAVAIFAGKRSVSER